MVDHTRLIVTCLVCIRVIWWKVWLAIGKISYPERPAEMGEEETADADAVAVALAAPQTPESDGDE